MFIYFVLDKSLDKYLRVSRDAFHSYISSLKCNIWSSPLYGGDVHGYFDKVNFVEFYEKPVAFTVEVADNV